MRTKMYNEFPETVKMLLKDVLNNHAFKLVLVLETSLGRFLLCFGRKLFYRMV